jgi:hypothetical protein
MNHLLDGVQSGFANVVSASSDDGEVGLRVRRAVERGQQALAPVVGVVVRDPEACLRAGLARDVRGREVLSDVLGVRPRDAVRERRPRALDRLQARLVPGEEPQLVLDDGAA